MEARAAATSRSAFSSQKRRSDESTRHIRSVDSFLYNDHIFHLTNCTIYGTKDFLHIFFRINAANLYLNTLHSWNTKVKIGNYKNKHLHLLLMIKEKESEARIDSEFHNSSVNLGIKWKKKKKKIIVRKIFLPITIQSSTEPPNTVRRISITTTTTFLILTNLEKKKTRLRD